jgi:hypothetical protein
MRKEILYHFTFLVGFLILTSLVKNYLSLSYYQYWIGGLIGTMLPDLDHLIYIYFLRPYELTSQRAAHLLGQRDVLSTLRLLAVTRYERNKIIFHTALFQIIFTVLALLIVTSSGSLLGRGIVLGFLLHLLVDQLVDYQETKSLSNWFKDFPLQFTFDEKKYIGVNIVVFLLLSFLL